MIVLVIAISIFLAVWIIAMGWQVGYFRSLSRKLKFTGRRIHLSPSNELEGARTGLDALTPGRCVQPHEPFERRSLIQKSRRLLVQGLLFGFVGVLATVILFILATRFGTLYLVIGPILVVPVLIFAHMRSNVRYIMNLIRTTPCPQCGKLPMDYMARSKDERRLLVCSQCRTEWDLGPAGL